MIRKFLIFASLAGFLLAVSTQAHPPYQNSQIGPAGSQSAFGYRESDTS